MRRYRFCWVATVLLLLVAATSLFFSHRNPDTEAAGFVVFPRRVGERSTDSSALPDNFQRKTADRGEGLIPLRDGLVTGMTAEELKAIYPQLLGAEGPPILVSMEKNQHRARLNFCFYPTREIPSPPTGGRLKLTAVYQEDLDQPGTNDSTGIYLFPPEMRGLHFTGLLDGWEGALESGY